MIIVRLENKPFTKCSNILSRFKMCTGYLNCEKGILNTDISNGTNCLLFTFLWSGD